ncbi:hypothetical protein TGRUB_268270 [Toxoplasma gondii RUB]|uniref:Toxoplasma gondii family A protein n=2 Tax=Toxoplasma gondii TaxID=5811 RepID=A0A086LXL4_TOXGO|nr:hypothetical protein TGRUB_268270 [Toxoplasma gondii RUB]KFH06259.1 hypothetical protein TGVAND_268270 [Toxoplasma gondii VAND]
MTCPLLRPLCCGVGRQRFLSVCIFLAAFSPALLACSNRVWPDGASPPASYFLIVEPEGITTPRTQEVSLLGGQSFALVDKTANGLEFNPASWDTTALPFDDSHCQTDQTISMGSLFPEATAQLWSQVVPQPAEAEAGVKKIYKFVTPPVEQLPRKAVNFCLVAYNKQARGSRTGTTTESETAGPALTLVFHAAGPQATFGIALATVFLPLFSVF